MIRAAGRRTCPRETPSACAGHDDRAGRHVAAVLDGSSPVTSMIGVEAVRTTFAPRTASSPDDDPLDDDAARADERAVLDHDGRRLGRLEHAADADAAREVDVAPICAQEPDGGPRVDHGPRPDPGADVDVARHEHDALGRGRSRSGRAAGGTTRTPSDASICFSGTLSKYVERADLDRLRAAAGGSRGGSPSSPTRCAPSGRPLLGDAHDPASSSRIASSTASTLAGRLPRPEAPRAARSRLQSVDVGHNASSRISAARRHSPRWERAPGGRSPRPRARGTRRARRRCRARASACGERLRRLAGRASRPRGTSSRRRPRRGSPCARARAEASARLRAYRSRASRDVLLVAPRGDRRALDELLRRRSDGRPIHPERVDHLGRARDEPGAVAGHRRALAQAVEDDEPRSVGRLERRDGRPRRTRARCRPRRRRAGTRARRRARRSRS